MKFSDIHENTEQTLTEGLKFGNKEMQQVDRESRDILVGIEYEYHVDEEITQSNTEHSDEYWNAVADRALDLIQEDIENKKEDWIDGYADNDMAEFNVESGTETLNTIKEFVHQHALKLNKIYDTEDSFNDIMEEWDEETDFPDEHKETIKEYMTAVQSVNDELTGNIEPKLKSLEYDEQLDRWVHIIGDKDIAEDLEQTKDLLNNFVIWSKYIKDIHFSDYSEIKSFYDIYYAEFSDISTYFDMINDLNGSYSDWDGTILEQFKDWGEDLWESEKEHILGYDPELWSETPFHEQAMEEIDESGDE